MSDTPGMLERMVATVNSSDEWSSAMDAIGHEITERGEQ